MKGFILGLGICASIGIGWPNCVFGEVVRPSIQSLQRQPVDKEFMEMQRGELKTMREYHTSLLDTVYWSLGTIVALALLLIGSSWYANLRIYENDKARIQEEVDKKLSQASASMSRELQRLSESLNDMVDRDVCSLGERLSSEINRLRDDSRAFDHQLTEDFKSLRDAFEVFLRMPGQINDRLVRIELDTQLIREATLKLKGDPVQLLLAQFLALEAASRAKDGDGVRAVLSRMRSNLRVLVSQNDKGIPSNLLPVLQASLAKPLEFYASSDASSSSEHSMLREIIELLDEVPTAEPISLD